LQPSEVLIQLQLILQANFLTLSQLLLVNKLLQKLNLVSNHFAMTTKNKTSRIIFKEK